MSKTRKKYDAFKAALEALCIKHGVQLATSGYDCISVFDLGIGQEPIFQDYIEDETLSQASTSNTANA